MSMINDSSGTYLSIEVGRTLFLIVKQRLKRKNKLAYLENRLKRSEELSACHPTEQNKLELEKLK